jgi:hypothetical protein
MSTMPPEEPGTTTTTTTTPAGGRGAYGILPGTTDFARLPIPGNAEFATWILLNVFLAILLLDNAWNANDWAFANVILGAAYLLSRGIAKASRVLEQ